MQDAWLFVAEAGDAGRPARALLPPARRLHGAHLHDRAGPAGRARLLPAASASTPTAEQSWRDYLRSVLAFSVVGVLVALPAPAHPGGAAVLARACPRCREGLSFNTAISFVTNTNWQSYSPETTLGYTVQLAGLAVQNFVSAAVGIAVAIALVRGLARPPHRHDRQLLGRPHPRRAAHPAAALGRRRGRADRRRRRSRTSPGSSTVHTITGGDRRRSRAARSPPRRRSRSSARTAAGSSTPTRRIRSRTRARGRTCSRSSCCC